MNVAALTEEFRTLRMRGRALPERVRLGREGAEIRESALTPRRISGHEGIGQLFEYRVEAIASAPAMFPFGDDEERIDLDKIKGTELTLTIELETVRHLVPERRGNPALTVTGDGKREISGIVASAGVLGVEGETIVYEFVLRPWCWRATLGTNSRVFTGSIVDIVYDVLHRYGGAIEWRLSGVVSPRRDLIRQAWESDWNFSMRLCEEFGYVMWFEHRDGIHILVIADNPGAFSKHAGAYETLRYHTGGGHINEEYITQLSFTSAVTLGTVTVHDHSYMSPRLNRYSLPYRESCADSRDPTSANHETYTTADYAQPLTRATVIQDDTSWHEDAQYLARIKLEAELCKRHSVKGSGHLRGVESGKIFTLTHYPHHQVNQAYLVLTCALDIREVGVMSAMYREYSVEASFELHPASEAYRMPQITPRPRIEGFEYAVIVGPEDLEMHVDAHNRVLIQFSWDRAGEYDGQSSIWVRVALPWQGNQMGVVVHGRCGQQVLVGYVNGDPDRPIVVMFLGDRDNVPPWKLPDNRALSGMVTRSLGRGTTSNHLALDDTESRQQAQLASDHAKSSLSLGYIARIHGNAGRQDARGEGFELRTDKWGALRAALGMLITTVARIGAQGKVKDMGETVARLTGAREIHESAAQLAQQRGAQDAAGDQAEVVQAIKTANAGLRGSSGDGPNDFPEFENPDIAISSAASLHTAAAGSTHIASDRHTALTTGGHLSVATGKSFFASVRDKIAFYGQKAITLSSTGPVRLESRTDELNLLSQADMQVTSHQGWVRIAAPKGIELACNNSMLRLTPDGVVIYTNGKFLAHAASHATDDPVGKPVDSPVTQDNPGKLAAHHVLVENGGGFAIPNQPYRLTLDDGQIIQGVTNELGELQMVTSNSVSFGVIELMSQSAQEDVIGVTNFSVYHDAALPPPPLTPVAAKRTVQVGGKAVNTPDEGPTTQSKPADYFTCDPLNFGLRTYRLINGAKQDDTPLSMDYRGSIDYPVARKYTAAVKAALMAIRWDDLAGKPADDIASVIVPAVQPAMWAALASGPFGLPSGKPDSTSKPGAMPIVDITTPESGEKYGMKPNYLGGFVSFYWVIAVSTLSLNRIFNSTGGLRTANVQELADTFYHESRHCQQKYWMISLFGSYPSDYEKFSNLRDYYLKTVNKGIVDAALARPFPPDERVRVGVHRMLIFDYYWSLMGTKADPQLQSLQADADVVEAEVCKLLNVTPEQARQMADSVKGYRSHLHEEDAYICGELVNLYWSDPDRTQLRNPGTCTRDYRATVRHIRGGGNAK
jgi:type VI secretion system secreted protein VgrG